MLTKIVLDLVITVVEKQKHWGNISRKEFLEVVKRALEEKQINEKTAFDLTKRAMAI